MKRVNKGKYLGEKMNSVVGLRSTKSNWKHDSGLQKDVSFEIYII